MGHSDWFLLGRVLMYEPLSWNQPRCNNFFFSLTGLLLGNSNCKTQKLRKHRKRVQKLLFSKWISFAHRWRILQQIQQLLPAKNYVSFHDNECSINTSVNKLSSCPTLSSNIPSSTFIFSCIRELSISNNKWVLLNIDSLTEFHKEAIFVPQNWRWWESTHMASDVHYLLCLINDWWRINHSWWLYWEKKQKHHANYVWLSVSKKSGV